jgi:hypothetical protein
MPLPPVWIVWTAIGVVLSSTAAAVQFQVTDKVNVFLMGVFRDIGRHKAYKRRYANQSMALMTFLLHQEGDPLLGSIQLDDKDEDAVPTYTMEELSGVWQWS